MKSSRRRSFDAIENADAVVFIFTKDGQSDGRGMEFEHVLSGPRYFIWKTIVIFEEDENGRRYGSDLVLDGLKEYGSDITMGIVSVDSIEELIETVDTLLMNLIQNLIRTRDYSGTHNFLN